jgi:hypothetical protein
VTIQSSPIRGEVRHVGFRRVAHGLFVRRADALSTAEEFLRDLEAWLLVLPTGAVFTHVTGARLLGWQLPVLPEQVPVFAAVHSGERRARRPGLLCSRLVDSGDIAREKRVVEGALPVDAPEEILLRCARDLGHLDLVIMLDSATRRGDIDDDRIAKVLASRRPGVRALRAAWMAADPRSESGGESVLRIFHETMGVPVEPQVDLYDGDRFVARADLLVIGTTYLHEYDGAGHRDKGQHRSDLKRERRLASTPYVRRGFTLDDLVNHPGVLMQELDRILGRAHQQGRLRRWRRMIDHSLYSPAGRSRIMNRWRREMGVVDWARTS